MHNYNTGITVGYLR